MFKHMHIRVYIYSVSSVRVHKFYDSVCLQLHCVQYIVQVCVCTLHLLLWCIVLQMFVS